MAPEKRPSGRTFSAPKNAGARRQGKATAAWNRLGMALSVREGRKGALDELTRAAGEKRKEAEDAFSTLQQQLNDAQRSIAEGDAHEAETKRRLQDKLRASG